MDIELWRAGNPAWRPELSVEDIVRHSKGRRDPEKNRLYFSEYRRKLRAVEAKPKARGGCRKQLHTPELNAHGEQPSTDADTDLDLRPGDGPHAPARQLGASRLLQEQRRLGRMQQKRELGYGCAEPDGCPADTESQARTGAKRPRSDGSGTANAPETASAGAAAASEATIWPELTLTDNRSRAGADEFGLHTCPGSQPAGAVSFCPHLGGFSHPETAASGAAQAAALSPVPGLAFGSAVGPPAKLPFGAPPEPTAWPAAWPAAVLASCRPVLIPMRRSKGSKGRAAAPTAPAPTAPAPFLCAAAAPAAPPPNGGGPCVQPSPPAQGFAAHDAVPPLPPAAAAIGGCGEQTRMYALGGWAQLAGRWTGGGGIDGLEVKGSGGDGSCGGGSNTSSPQSPSFCWPSPPGAGPPCAGPQAGACGVGVTYAGGCDTGVAQFPLAPGDHGPLRSEGSSPVPDAGAGAFAELPCTEHTMHCAPAPAAEAAATAAAAAVAHLPGSVPPGLLGRMCSRSGGSTGPGIDSRALQEQRQKGQQHGGVGDNTGQVADGSCYGAVGACAAPEVAGMDWVESLFAGYQPPPRPPPQQQQQQQQQAEQQQQEEEEKQQEQQQAFSLLPLPPQQQQHEGNKGDAAHADALGRYIPPGSAFCCAEGEWPMQSPEVAAWDSMLAACADADVWCYVDVV